ncbi:glutathione S-transferase family protein [Devosia naphthalenivorans]|uniref:glutathione S-transferase family protein n=1 Tax=Devosia naphthalenivorans TaxID=2082392 RepID=UPI000D3733ED|nr:glutathione S-transferase N-terminal domain-containing protein [Devosia naphthalenivorans]
MIELFASTSPNVTKVILMLEETGLDYKITPVDVHRGEQYGQVFQALNPNGKVPVIADHDAAGGATMTIFESGAILMYLAEKTGHLLTVEPMERYQVVQWLMIQMAGVGPNFGQFNHFVRYAAKEQYSVDRFTSEVRRLYDLLDARLGEARFLGGYAYSIADVATVPWIRVQAKLFGATHRVLNFGWPEHPHLRRWFEAILERPAAKRAFSISENLPSHQHEATQEERDRYFARGQYAQTLDR